MTTTQPTPITLSATPRILIVLMGSLGDVARGLCLLAPIRAHFPEATIDWLVEPACEGLVRIHPEINNVIVFDRPRGLRALPQLFRELRRGRYDLVLDLQRHAKSGLFGFLSGARQRAGFHRADSKEGNWLWNTHHIPQFGATKSKVDHYLTFLQLLGIGLPQRVTFGFESLSTAGIDAQFPELRGGAFAAVLLGSRWASKDYPVNGILGLVPLLQGRGLRCVLVGGPSQRTLAATVLEQHPTAIDCVGRTTIPELLAILKRARVAIGPDSGPGHLCATVGTPYVGLFGPTDPSRTAPYGNEALAITSEVPCRPCGRRVCPGLHNLCLQLIHPTEIVQNVDSALERTPQ